jgi:hypothetical protein
MLCVLPDTNQLRGQLYAGGAGSAWQRLGAHAAAGRIRLTVPEIVHFELVNQMREDAHAALAAQAKAAGVLERLGVVTSQRNVESDDIDALLIAGSENIRRSVLGVGGEFVPIPEVDHSELLRRSLHRQPPFDGKDRGYRDTLIWHNILELVRAGEEVLLVSSDTRAFAATASRTVLHPTLVLEVIRICGEAERVRLCETIPAALELIGQGDTPIREVAERALASERLARELAGEILVSADGVILDGQDLVDMGYPAFVGVRVYPERPLGQVRLKDATPIADGSLEIQARIATHAELDARWYGDRDSDDDFALIGDGKLDDIGAGLLDGLFQLRIKRDAEIHCTARLTTIDQDLPGDAGPDWQLASVRVTGIKLPRQPIRPGPPWERLPGHY